MALEKVAEEVEKRENFLEELVRGEIIEPIVEDNDELKFIIARKWNSWYPSFFKTLGGCYVIQTRDNDHVGLKKDKNSGSIVIDPGFGFLDELRFNYKIEPNEIRSIIVTHFHPDHTAGLIEFLTLTHESKHPCNIYLNQTSFEFFKAFQGKYNKVLQLNGRQTVELAKYKYTDKKHSDNRDESVYLKAEKVHHSEIGNTHQSLGLIFRIKSKTKTWNLGILSDTDGSDSYMNDYVESFKDVDILVLHLGTFSDKHYGSGDKHLYKSGLFNLLSNIKENPDFMRKLKLIVISEFGLEMADMQELEDLCGDFFKSMNFFSFMVFAKYAFKSDSIFHKSIFSRYIYKLMKDCLSSGSINKDSLYASLFGLLIILNPNGFKDSRPIDINIDYILDNNLALADYKNFGIDMSSEHISDLSRTFYNYIKELIQYEGEDIDLVIETNIKFLEYIYKDLTDKKFYKSPFGDSLADISILAYMKKYIKSLGIEQIDESLLKDIYDKIDNINLQLILSEVLVSIILLYKAHIDLKKDKNPSGLMDLSAFKQIKIMEEILIKFKEMEANGDSRKILLSHEGLEMMFEDSIYIKGFDELDKIDWIDIDEVDQRIDPISGLMMIRKISNSKSRYAVSVSSAITSTVKSLPTSP